MSDADTVAALSHVVNKVQEAAKSVENRPALLAHIEAGNFFVSDTSPIATAGSRKVRMLTDSLHTSMGAKIAIAVGITAVAVTTGLLAKKAMERSSETAAGLANGDAKKSWQQSAGTLGGVSATARLQQEADNSAAERGR